MFVKNKIVRLTIIAVLVLICLYNGICCAATLHKAVTQPWLVSGTVRFEFMGYYIMSAVNGVICLLSAVILGFLVRIEIKNNRPTEPPRNKTRLKLSKKRKQNVCINNNLT